MRKYILLLFILTQLHHSSFSQSDTSILSVIYEFGILTDTLNPENFYKENMVLLIGQKRSLYKSYDKYLLDSAFNENLSKTKDIRDIQFTARRPTTITQRLQEYSD